MNFSLQDLIQILLAVKSVPSPSKALQEGIEHLENQIGEHLKAFQSTKTSSLIQ